MPEHIRKCAFLIFVASAFASAAQNAPSQALGQIVTAKGASLRGVAVPSGGTLISGDTLSTSADGGALVRFSTAGQAELSANTTAVFTGTPDRVIATVSQGTVVITAAAPQALTAQTSECSIQAQNAGSASYSITASSGAGASITAREGAAVLTELASGRRLVLAEGETSACPIPAAATAQAESANPAPGERAGQAAPAAAPAGQSHAALLVLLLGGGAAAGIGVAVAGHGGGTGTPASPTAP
jgi:hypothetical protein